MIFYLKRGDDMFLKVMHVAEELERSCTNLSATSLSLPYDVRRYVSRIPAELFPLLREEKEDCESG